MSLAANGRGRSGVQAWRRHRNGTLVRARPAPTAARDQLSAMQRALRVFRDTGPPPRHQNPAVKKPDRPRKSHHRPTGFQNNYLQFPGKSLAQVLRWQWDARRNGLPPRPRAPTPQVAPDLAFLQANAMAGARMQPTVTWIGHATVLVQSGGLTLLTDPVFSARASPVGFVGRVRGAEAAPAARHHVASAAACRCGAGFAQPLRPPRRGIDPQPGQSGGRTAAVHRAAGPEGMAGRPGRAQCHRGRLVGLP